MANSPIYQQLDDEQQEIFEAYYQATLGATTEEQLQSAKDSVLSQFPGARYEIWFDYLHKDAVKHLAEMTKNISIEDVDMVLPRSPLSDYLQQVEISYVGKEGEAPDESRIQGMQDPHLQWLRLTAQKTRSVLKEHPNANPQVAARYALDTHSIEMPFKEYLDVRETRFGYKQDVGQSVPLGGYLAWYCESKDKFENGKPKIEVAQEMGEMLNDIQGNEATVSVGALYSLYKAYDIHPCHEAATYQWAQDYVAAGIEHDKMAMEPSPSMSYG